MKYFKVSNLEKYQHYKDRNPPWIKVYTNLFEDYKFSCLQDASKMHLIGIWLLASKLDNQLPFDEKWIGSRIAANSLVDLNPLLDAGFIEMVQYASKPLATCNQNAIPETETKREKEKSKEESIKPKKYFFDSAYYKTLKDKQVQSSWSLTAEEKTFMQEYELNQVKQMRK